jgi:hypothetical protein
MCADFSHRRCLENVSFRPEFRPLRPALFDFGQNTLFGYLPATWMALDALAGLSSGRRQERSASDRNPAGFAAFDHGIGDLRMTRNAASRAGIMFVLLALVFGALSFGSRIEAALVVAGIAGALCAVLLVFAAALPARPAPIPVRIRRTDGRRFYG